MENEAYIPAKNYVPDDFNVYEFLDAFEKKRSENKADIAKLEKEKTKQKRPVFKYKTARGRPRLNLSEDERKERAKESTKRWQKANREKMRDHLKRWQSANPEKVREIARKAAIRRYARVKRAGTHTPDEALEVFLNQSGGCALCACKMELGNREKDHIIPIAKGGSNTIDNIQWLCIPCNRRKSASVETPHKNKTSSKHSSS